MDKVKVKVVQVQVCGGWSAQHHSESTGERINEIGTNVRIDLLQKTTLLGTARILRKTLKI